MLLLDEKRWTSAWARFQALRKNIPDEIDEEQVREYNSLLMDLVMSSGQSLFEFEIPNDLLKPKLLWARRGTRRQPGYASYSKKRYCDLTDFRRRIDDVWNYFQSLQAEEGGTTRMDEPKDYWSLSDDELERLGAKYNLRPISRAGAQGEYWYVDRDRVIDALLKRDAALRSGSSTAAPSNVVNVGTMYALSIQQGTDSSTANINFKTNDPDLKNVLKMVRDSANQIPLGNAAKAQLMADMGTAEAQLSSPHPKPSIITECLHSMRVILETAAGSAIAAGLLLEISKFLGS